MTALSLLDNAVLLSSDSDAAAPQQTYDCITTVCRTS